MFGRRGAVKSADPHSIAANRTNVSTVGLTAGGTAQARGRSAAGAAEGGRDSPTGRQNGVFFALTLGVFLVTRLWGLERFPIFFFCDEAVQTVQADRFVANGFRGEQGELLPTYFRNTEFFNLSLGVYLQVLPEALWPRSVFVARAVPAAVLCTAMLAVGLILRDFFRLRFYWVGVLALSGFPGWFLHTRIAFELMLATTAYVWCLYFYLRYRSGRHRSLYVAALFGTLTFYGYNTFQLVIVLTALLLGAVDARYHWAHRRTVLLAAGLLLLSAVPYLRFIRAHPTEVASRLQSLDSHWTDPARGLPEKLGLYAREYARAYDPRYWFRPNPPGELARHTMKGYAYVPIVALPFVIAGIGLCAWRIRSPGERTLLVALLAAPAGAAIVRPNITRAMILIVLFGMLLGVAADPLLRWLARRTRPLAVGLLVFVGLAAAQGRMLADALVHGPTWYSDYGMYGMQWGAREVMGEVARLRKRHPSALILISPDWANGTDDVVEFFAPGREGIRVVNVDWLRYEKRDVPEQTLAVMTESEYQSVRGDPRFAQLRLEKTLPYPDGRPGFRFVWVTYAPDFEKVLTAEREAWRQLVLEDAEIEGASALVEHSAFDVGAARDLFDGDDRSLVRTTTANPAVLVLSFDPARPLRELILTIGTMDCEVLVDVSGPGGEASCGQTYRGLGPDPTVAIPLPAVGGPISRLRISVRDVNSGEPDKLHLREVRLR
jgi:hypothetical protein